MAQKELKRDYLRRILNINRDDAGYYDMDTCMKEYNKFMRTLNYCDTRGGEEEKIFVYFYKHGLTVSNIVAKQKGKECLIRELKEVLDKALEYYEKYLFIQYYDEAIKKSPKDFLIQINDKARVNSVVGAIADVDEFLISLDAQWSEFNRYLYDTIHLALSGAYSKEKGPNCLKIDDFDLMVKEEVEYYCDIVKTYSKSLADTSGTYYTGKNDNPYKNLYVYCLNAYIKNFYVIDIPNVILGKFFELENFQDIELTNIYGLSDIARNYANMTNGDYKKSYGKIKQQFRKSKFMQEYKKDGKYKFNEISIPLATYVYYSRKNHIEPEFNNLFMRCDPVIVKVYAPILYSLINGENKKILAYNSFQDFITKEFKDILNRVDDAYLNTFIEILLQCPMRLYYRCMGMDVNSVCG